MSSPMLWQNDDHSVTLIDIPRSIAAAQGTEESPCSDILISSEPILRPYPTNEPRSKKAKANLQGNTVEEQLHQQYRDLLQQALQDVKEHHKQDWCLARRYDANTDASEGPKKRKLDHTDLAADEDLPSKRPTATASLSPSRPRAVKEPCSVCESEYDGFQTNCSPSPLKNQMVRQWEDPGADADALRMPPNSSFYLGNCSESLNFHACIRHQAVEHDTPRHFDFIVLDPPWPNKSVKRSNGYETTATLDEIYDLIAGTDLDMLMADECLVGIWITNKQAIRDLVLGEGGIFEVWGVDLVEEWLYLKTTLQGSPVTPIDSMWRKPYEVLLLGRKRRRGTQLAPDPNHSVRRRVIIAVPDLHSRKPCLKELIEPLMPNRKDYRALEVFARHLVAEWWSWGNECTKFNHESNWHRAEDSEK